MASYCLMIGIELRKVSVLQVQVFSCAGLSPLRGLMATGWRR